MTRAELPLHADNHKTGGSDPIPGLGSALITTDGTDTVDPTDTLSFSPVYFDITETPTGTAYVTAVTGLGTPGPAGPVFGDGSDGNLTLTQTSAAPSWAAKSGAGSFTTFTINRDLYAIDLDLDNTNGAFLLETGGFRIFCTGTFTIDSGVTVHRNGNAGSISGIVGAALNNGTIGGSQAGGAGGAGTNGSNPSPTSSTSIATNSRTATTLGGAGGAATGGPGTGGGNATGGQASRPATEGEPRHLFQATQLITQTSQNPFTGGAGGGGGDAGALAVAGAGGSGGGIVAIYAHRIVNNGTISAQGGGGGAASTGGGTGAGGGGGGSGGAIVLVYVNDGVSDSGTLTVAGGSGGALFGTGKNGANGTTGLIWEFPL